MFRKVLFQIHLWTGLVLGLYVVAICVSGSVTVFRNEFYTHFRPGTRVEPRDTERLSDEGIAEAARRVYPGFEVTTVALRRRTPTASAEVWLKKGEETRHRLFDPYTGADLGDAEPRATQIFEKVAAFHDHLLFDRTGRTLNGLGGVFLAVMCLTGMVLWWPGVGRLLRAMGVRWNASWKRFNWDLHSAMGFWTFALVFMWAITGIYMIFPGPFLDVVDYLQPPTDDVPLRTGDTVLEWFARAHIGRFAGLGVKIVWAVGGLVPPALFVTGVIMWWNRKVRGWRRAEEGPFAYGAYVRTFLKAGGSKGTARVR